MANKESAPWSQTFSVKLNWRSVLVCILTIVGIISLVGFMLVHWTERQLLTTGNWVAMVAPLSKQESVASSLSDYSVNKVFAEIDLQDKIANALPPRASFLAVPLTEQLTVRTKRVAQNLITSDQFQTVWISANQTAHSRLMDKARSEDSGQPTKERTSFNLNLESLKSRIQTLLGPAAQQLFQKTGNKANEPTGDGVGLKVDLQNDLATFKRYVAAVDFLNATLWLVGSAALLGALALSTARRKLMIIIGFSLMAIALLQLIGVRVLRPTVINLVENSSYRPAVGYVYDSLLQSFKQSATNVLLFSVALTTALLAVPYVVRSKWWVSFYKLFSIAALEKNVRKLRTKTRRYLWLVIGGAALLALIFMAFAPDIDGQGVINTVLVFLTITSLVYLLATPASKTKTV